MITEKSYPSTVRSEHFTFPIGTRWRPKRTERKQTTYFVNYKGTTSNQVISKRSWQYSSSIGNTTMPAITIEAIGRLFDVKMDKHNKALDDRFAKMKMDIITQIKMDTDKILKTELEKSKYQYIVDADEKLEELTTKVNKNEELISTLEKRICDLEETVDNQINRSMRNNLIIKGIQQGDDEKMERHERDSSSFI